MLRETVINNLKRIVADRKMTWQKLGKRAGMGPPQVSRFLHGQSSPTLDTIQRLGIAAQVDPHLLFINNSEASDNV